jgi:hypothetical protein
MDRAKWVTGSCFSWHRVLRRKHFTVPLLWQLAGKLIHGYLWIFFKNRISLIETGF